MHHTGPAVAAIPGDFDGDGVLDLADAPDLWIARVLIGKGDGTFITPSSYAGLLGAPAALWGGAVAEGDLDGDQALDLVTVGEGVGVLLGRGDGTFEPTAMHNVSDDREVFLAVTTGDFDGDGRLDVVTGAPFVRQTVPSGRLLRGNGDGTFQPWTTHAGSGEFVTVGDFNGDGRPDVATADLELGEVQISLGSGDGTFLPAITTETGVSLAVSIVAGDFDSDGNLDVAVGGDRHLAVRLGNGDGTFRAAPEPDLGSETAMSMATADFDGDDRRDLAVATSRGVRVLFGSGHGDFMASEVRSAGASPFSLSTADFNGDGRPDVAVAGQDGTVVLLNACCR